MMIFNDATIRVAVDAWLKNPTMARIKYGDINYWNTRNVTNMTYFY